MLKRLETTCCTAWNSDMVNCFRSYEIALPLRHWTTKPGDSAPCKPSSVTISATSQTKTVYIQYEANMTQAWSKKTQNIRTFDIPHVLPVTVKCFIGHADCSATISDVYHRVHLYLCTCVWLFGWVAGSMIWMHEQNQTKTNTSYRMHQVSKRSPGHAVQCDQTAFPFTAMLVFHPITSPVLFFCRVILHYITSLSIHMSCDRLPDLHFDIKSAQQESSSEQPTRNFT